MLLPCLHCSLGPCQSKLASTEASVLCCQLKHQLSLSAFSFSFPFQLSLSFPVPALCLQQHSIPSSGTWVCLFWGYPPFLVIFKLTKPRANRCAILEATNPLKRRATHMAHGQPWPCPKPNVLDGELPGTHALREGAVLEGMPVVGDAHAIKLVASRSKGGPMGVPFLRNRTPKLAGFALAVL